MTPSKLFFFGIKKKSRRLLRIDLITFFLVNFLATNIFNEQKHHWGNSEKKKSSILKDLFRLVFCINEKITTELREKSIPRKKDVLK